MTDPVRIRLADPDEIGAVGEVMALAFHDDAVTRWLIDDDPTDRAQIMPPYFTMLAKLGLDGGAVYVSGDFDAVAVWIDAAVPAPAPPAEPDQQLRRMCDRHTDRFHALDHQLHRAQQGLPAHQHLWFLAVRPPRQRQGLGAALLRAHHERLDADGMPAYLDASSLDSRRLYLRHGYTDVRTPFSLPGGGPSMWPMWRPVGGVGEVPEPAR